MAGGRIPVCPGIAPGTAGFNPRPPLLAGESSQAGGHPLFMGVSIRARHCWRANAGRGADGQFQHVSIRARHCWRANGYQWIERDIQTGFNPRPPLLAGESAGYTVTGVTLSFNPRPPLLAGECLYAAIHGLSMAFQSAPAIAGGRI